MNDNGLLYPRPLMLKGQYGTFLQYILTSLNTSGYNVAG